MSEVSSLATNLNTELASPVAGSRAESSSCRICGTPLRHVFVDMGKIPLCQAILDKNQLNDMERFYPLRTYVCSQCYLVQVDEFVSPDDLFSEYAYFSSYSDSWLAHAKRYCEKMIAQRQLDESTQVIEIASNDGYLLQNFVARGIPSLGVEPAANVAKVAQDKGIPCVVKFFGEQTACELIADGKRADLLLGNNVLAHVPDLNDFVGGMKILLADGGVITMEFPHLLRLYEENQFDTIYHEHFSYLSLITVQKLFASHGLTIFDVEEIPTHGGSIRIFARHEANEAIPVSQNVDDLFNSEVEAGFKRIGTYERFAEKVIATKHNLLAYLIEAKRAGRSIIGYGAAGKGSTLLSYCGIREDFLDYVVDRNPYKHGKFLPGTHIPIVAPEAIARTKPDDILILPWNLKDEIMQQLAYAKEWNARFVVPIPEVTIYE